MTAVARVGACRQPAGLFLRCVGWGLATGAACGGVSGLVLGILGAAGGVSPVVIPGAAIYGVVLGTLVALVPSVVGALAVTVVLQQRQRQPSSPDAVRRDLGVTFGVVVGTLDATVLVATFACANKLSHVTAVVAVLALLNLLIAPILGRARDSLTRAWTRATA